MLLAPVPRQRQARPDLPSAGRALSCRASLDAQGRTDRVFRKPIPILESTLGPVDARARWLHWLEARSVERRRQIDARPAIGINARRAAGAERADSRPAIGILADGRRRALRLHVRPDTAATAEDRTWRASRTDGPFRIPQCARLRMSHRTAEADEGREEDVCPNGQRAAKGALHLPLAARFGNCGHQHSGCFHWYVVIGRAGVQCKCACTRSFRLV